jgi:hypothetical protein
MNMMDRWHIVSTQMTRKTLTITLILLWTLIAHGAEEQDPNTIEINLHYRESAGYTSSSLNFDDSLSLVKTPDIPSGSTTVKGYLRTHPERNKSMAFVIDIDQAKLYLDLNLNRDLTDDPNGFGLNSRTHGGNNRHQRYEDIILTIPRKELLHRYRIAISLDYYGQDQKYGYVNVYSRYGGTFTLNGAQWKMTLNENLDGRLSSGDSITLHPPQHESARLNLPSSLFLNERAYTCKTNFASDNQQRPRVVFSLIPKDLPLGQLNLTGQYLHYLKLTSKDITIPIFAPQPTITIPIGSYRCSELTLRTPEQKITVSHRRFDTEFEITANEPYTLQYGGPLIPSITATQKGQSVSLGFELKGQGGEAYHISHENKPGFTVFKGNLEIDSGEFEYG